ncbi:MAG: T9SS type A sorting domain-containing protein [Ignavibacteria bacterium]|nr:T9SS type A sorting domain-containing protein [Ignavibacteria bacterium]
MKKLFTILLLLCLFTLGFAQRANIKIEPVTPDRLSKLGFPTQSVSAGLHVIGVETYVYLSAQNIGNAEPITNAVWEFTSRPSGSTAAFTYPYANKSWAYFMADRTGAYGVKLTITTASGTDDTTITIYAAKYVGVGGFENIAAVFPNCMSCHGGSPKFTGIFNNWKASSHANFFKTRITTGPSVYGTFCFKCHTTGYDNTKAAANDGFDDRAAQLGWVWSNYAPPKPGNWDTLKTRFPSLVQFATIGCESCHGPGSEHSMGGSKDKISIDYASDACGQCHDSPTYYNEYAQWMNSGHSNPIWSSSFAQSTAPTYMSNTLDNCIRCHDGRGFINRSKGQGTDTRGMIQAQLTHIGCPTCHDPHGNGQPYSLRTVPAGYDTLATGQQITLGGKGKVCMNCHIARRNAATYVQTNVTSATWGPHYSTQGDVLLGVNAADFGTPFISTNHKFVVQDGCVGCHMYPTTDTGTVAFNKVGGHSMHLRDPQSGYEHVKACQGCHGPQIQSFEDFIAAADFDGDGTIESIRKEVDGLMKNIRIALPPVGIDSISWTMIRDANNLNMRKAYYNYRLIYGDHSYGMHNAKFTIDVLRKSLAILTGVEITDNNIPTTYDLSQNYPNPFNPTTEIKFNVPKSERVRIAVYNSIGKLVKVLVDDNLAPGSYKVTWNGEDNRGQKVTSGVYLYRMETPSFQATKKMVLLK